MIEGISKASLIETKKNKNHFNNELLAKKPIIQPNTIMYLVLTDISMQSMPTRVM